MNAILTAVLLLATFPVSVVGYNAYVAKRMARELPKVERDPVTGIVKGAEPIYLEGKNGKACLLIHGFIGTPTDFAHLPEILHEEGFTVSAPLLPGHGTDPRDFSKVAAEELEQFVHDKYAELKQTHSEVILIGMSMGGALSVIEAVEHGVDRLILLAPYFKVKHFWYYILPTEFHQKIAGPFIPYLYRTAHFKQVFKRQSIPHIIDYNYTSTKGSAEAMKIAGKARTLAPRISISTLIIHSKLDKATDYAVTKKITDALGEKSVGLITLEKSNHLILWDYESEMVEREILGFIREQTGENDR